MVPPQTCRESSVHESKVILSRVRAVQVGGHNTKVVIERKVLNLKMRLPLVIGGHIFRQGSVIVTIIALVFVFIFVIQHMTYTQTSGPSTGFIREAVDQALDSMNIRFKGRISPISTEYNLLDLDETDPRLAELAAEKCTIGKA
jgi:hypothetical protein